MKYIHGDNKGHFGPFGGAYVSEMLYPAIAELQEAFTNLVEDESFAKELHDLFQNFSGRPTPLTSANQLSELLTQGKAKIYLKREDLNHSGAHKMNNVLGQGLLMNRIGKKRVIAETGAGQHGVATAIMAAKFGFQATIYMGAEDVERQYTNVFWMRQLGAEVISVESGTRTLKDAINAALRDWASHYPTTHYCLGTACGPRPFPEMVNYFQSIIGKEIKAQFQDQVRQGGSTPLDSSQVGSTELGAVPDRIYACVGGGSNALGAFTHFIDDPQTRLIGVEAGGKGLEGEEHAARIAGGSGKFGISQGYSTLFLQTDEGQMKDTWSIAAGLDYVGVSPILADLHRLKRVEMTAATDKEVLEAFKLMVKSEGIIPALESSHAVAAMIRDAKTFKDGERVVVMISGRGDKDFYNISKILEKEDC